MKNRDLAPRNTLRRATALALAALLCPALLPQAQAAPATAPSNAGGTQGEGRNSMFEREVDTIILGRSADNQRDADLRGDAVANQGSGADGGGQWRQLPPTHNGGQATYPAQDQPQQPQQGQMQPQAQQALPTVPLGDITESNAELTLGTSLPKGSVWQLNRFEVQSGSPRQVYRLSPSAALTVYFDPVTRRAVKISIAAVHVPSIYGPSAKTTFENECLMAVLFGGNLFVEMERNPGLAQAMQDRLSLRDPALLQGKIIDFGLTEAPILYSARLEGGRYTLDITARNR